MANKHLHLKTNKFDIRPMTFDELEAFLGREEEGERKDTFAAMLEKAKAHPQDDAWYVPWKVCKDKTDEIEGFIGFNGPADHYCVELLTWFDDDAISMEHEKEAAEAVASWALTNSDVSFVEKRLAPDDTLLREMYTQIHFSPDADDETGTVFVQEQRPSNLMAIFMCIGMCVGASLGKVTGNLTTGMCIGLAVGLCLGMMLDGQKKQKLAESRKEYKKQLK